MTMIFERYRFQTKIEGYLNCHDVSKWKSYLHKFKEFEVKNQHLEELKNDLHDDGLDCLYKGLYSISNGLFNIHHKYYSWSVIKFYYGVFYLLRSYFAAKNIGFLKNNGIFTLKVDVNQKPVRRDGGKHQGENVTGDHKTTIVTYEKEFLSNDILLTNTINDVTIYHWLMDLRNQVHYRERSFNEPTFKYFADEVFDSNKIKGQVELYLRDSVPIYCFDQDHASIAAPLKILQEISLCFYKNTNKRLAEEKITVIEKMLRPMGLHDIPEMKRILYPEN